MQVGVLRTTRAVLVRGGDEAAAVLTDEAVLAATGDARLVLEVPERRLPGFEVGFADGPAYSLVAERVEEADALGHAEHEVEARNRGELLLLGVPLARVRVDPLDGDRPLLRMPPKPLASERIQAANESPKLPVLDDAFETQSGSAAPCPHPRRLAASGVVVIEARRHRALVVRLLARRELRDRQHVADLSRCEAFLHQDASASRVLSRLVGGADGVGA